MKESHTVAPVEPPNPAGKGSISQGPLGNTQNVLQSSPFPSFYSLTPNCVRQRLPLPFHHPPPSSGQPCSLEKDLEWRRGKTR